LKRPRDGGGIKFVDRPFDLPLVSAEAEIVCGEDFGRGVGTIPIGDAKVQVTVGIDENVGRIGVNVAGDATVARCPGAAHPLDGVGGLAG